MHKSVFIFSLLFNILAFGQNSFTTVIKDSLANELLSGATAKIKGTNNGEIADREGKVIITNIPNGKQTLIFSYLGYEKLELELTFPLDHTIPFVFMESANKEMDQVVVVGTRNNRSISKTPTRVEVLTQITH
jgi:iron complex outermembrane receptor protein